MSDDSDVLALRGDATQHAEVTATRRSRALPIVWVAWLCTACLTWGIFIAAMPLRYAQALAQCAPPNCADAAAYLVALDAFTSLIWFALALLIFWRRPGDRMGIFTSLTLLTFGVARFPDTPLALSAAYPGWLLPVEALRFLGSACLSLFVFVFPDGHFIPRITRWIAAAWIIVQIPEFFLSSSVASSDSWSPLLRFAGFFGFVLAVAAAQTWRYRLVSTPRQREQTRWVVFGVTLALICYLALAFGYPLLIAANRTAFRLPQMVLTSLISLTFLLVPISIAIAMLRHRLYDVDTLINRALVYGSLTTALAALYIASVVVLQALVVVLTGKDQIPSLVFVISTLATAALIQPLRHALQQGIDRRFYRRKYDASATIATFAASLRQDVDLAALRERLIEVAQEAMQPTQISLWLRSPEQSDRPQTPENHVSRHSTLSAPYYAWRRLPNVVE